MTTQRLSPSTVEVSKKGGVSVYIPGRRFPLTLYKAQWKKLLTMEEDIRSFILENDAALHSIEENW